MFVDEVEIKVKVGDGGDYTPMAGPQYPWFVRGGQYSSVTIVGCFAFGDGRGGIDSYLLFRLVLSAN